MGELLSIASIIPKLALEPMNSPCPMTTAGFPVARPYTSAIIAAVCSWRHKMVLIRSSLP